MTLFLIGAITLFSFYLRFLKLGSIPFFSNSFPLTVLIQNAAINIISSFVIYAIAKMLFNKHRISLLSFFIFSSLPWVIETGRNGVYSNFLLFWILILILLLLLLKKVIYSSSVLNILRPVIFLGGVSAILFLLKKPTWIFSYTQHVYTAEGVLSNIFHLISPSFLFFLNDSFWHGGNKEWGIVLLILAPFFCIGVIDTFKQQFTLMSVWLLTGILLSVLNPYFPEAFEFYICIPIFVFSTARGLYNLRSFNKRIIFLFILLFIFEYASFLHTYFIHYPENTRDYFQNLKKPL